MILHYYPFMNGYDDDYSKHQLKHLLRNDFLIYLKFFISTKILAGIIIAYIPFEYSHTYT